MADKPSYRVPSQDKPTYLNRDAFLWAGIASLPPLAVATGGLSFVAGLVGGAIYGKHRMQKDVEQGKLVNPPTFWNKDLGIALTWGAISVGVAAGIVGGALLGSVLGPGAALIAGTAGALIGGIGLPIFFGNRRKAGLEREYEAAKEFVAAKEQAQAMGMGHTPALSREESALLDARLSRSHNDQKRGYGAHTSAALEQEALLSLNEPQR